jgi:hypothetical protein
VVVETLGPGAVLGWSWLFPPYQWHFDAYAVETTFAVRMDGFGVRRLCDADHELGYQLIRRFMQVAVDRLQKTRMRLLDLYAVRSEISCGYGRSAPDSRRGVAGAG